MFASSSGSRDAPAWLIPVGFKDRRRTMWIF
jgi:hypothetical protein